MSRLSILLLGMLLAAPAVAADYAPLPGMTFKSVLPADGKAAPAQIAAFQMRTEPVTNAEFLAFVTTNPEWRRDQVASIFADRRYLTQWTGPITLGDDALPDQPVTRVSWFAAQAFCESEQARLPTWYEWEYAAAADTHRTDARSDPKWRESVLAWYGRPANTPLPHVGGSPNVYGLRDLNGLVWEWVSDFNALLVGVDSRDQDGADKSKFCGAGALNMQQKENYATLMRVAMLSSLKASDTATTMGFRCVRSP